jgi:hypothetical protein
MKRLPTNLFTHDVEILQALFLQQPKEFIVVSDLTAARKSWVQDGLRNDWRLTTIHNGPWDFTAMFSAKVFDPRHGNRYTFAVTKNCLVNRR